MKQKPAEIYVPEPYQEIATRHIVENEAVILAGGALCLMEMGTGKTISTLTAFVELKSVVR